MRSDDDTVAVFCSRPIPGSSTEARANTGRGEYAITLAVAGYPAIYATADHARAVGWALLSAAGVVEDHEHARAMRDAE